MKRDQRLQLLSDEDIQVLYARPEFNETQRQHYFSLPEPLLNRLQLKKTNRHRAASHLYLILQYGYFKAKHQFFHFAYDAIAQDVAFIMTTYMPLDDVPSQLPSRKKQREIKNTLLEYMKFSDDRQTIQTAMLKQSEKWVRMTQNPLEITNHILRHLEENKWVLPKYSLLQDCIGAALKQEEKRLMKSVSRYLTKKVTQSLEYLLASETHRHIITELKFDAKSFKMQSMQQEIKKLTWCQPIYHFSKRLLPKLSLSRGVIAHYSDLAKWYSVDRLKKLPRTLVYFYLICYVSHRYERLTNNLIQAFIYYVDKYHQAGKQYAKNELPTFSDQLETHKQAIGELIKFYVDPEILSLSGNEIQQQAFDILPEKEMITVSQHLLEGSQSLKRQERKLIWAYHGNNYQAVRINLRPLFLAIEFDGVSRLSPLLKSINFLKTSLEKERDISTMLFKRIPVDHIRPKALLDIFTKKKHKKKVMNRYQYEFYIYRSIRENLKKCQIYVNDSLGYKSFEEEVKIDVNWEKEKVKKLKALNNPVLSSPIDSTLEQLKSLLEPLLKRTNERAMRGENHYINIKKHRDGSREWILPYPKKNDEIDNPFYDKLETRSISEVFDFVEQRCHFMKAFIHIKPKESSHKMDYVGIKGVLLGNGTMQGTHAFSKRSNLLYKRLQLAEKNHVRLDTLREAAHRILDHLVNLPIFEHYHLNEKKHGSVDGTKKKTRRRILKSRYSPKYFGLDMGVVILTMILNYTPVITEIIGANEHESHFLYAMHHRNLSEFDPDIISTDTAGTNNINDFLYYLIGKTHAPCYRSLPDRAQSICGFKPLSHYKDYLIKPSKVVNEALIKQQWEALLPILAALLSHDINQTNLIKKLSSHDYKSETKAALWELNNILNSIHILNYIDDPDYRRYIRTALNRGEAYHQLLHKITSEGGNQFRGMNEMEIEIWNECARLIALIIIYYNMHLLSKLYETAKQNNDQVVLDYLKHISPIASQHINISGLYEFSESIATIDIESAVAILSQLLEEVKSNHDA